jgi:hypothetical protein
MALFNGAFTVGTFSTKAAPSNRSDAITELEAESYRI